VSVGDLEAGWARTRKLLADARLGLAGIALGPDADAQLRYYVEYLEHNELELAMDSLAEAAEASLAPSAFWRTLAQAASSMGLVRRAAEFSARGQVTA
jgi:hypothetical protein